MGQVIFYDAYKGDFGGRDPFLNHHKEFWYSTEGYTKVQIYFCAYGDGDNKYVMPPQFREARHWMEESCEGEVIIKYDDRGHSGFILAYAYFRYESDAVAFKLAWLNKQDENKENEYAS